MDMCKYVLKVEIGMDKCQFNTVVMHLFTEHFPNTFKLQCACLSKSVIHNPETSDQNQKDEIIEKKKIKKQTLKNPLKIYKGLYNISKTELNECASLSYHQAI